MFARQSRKIRKTTRAGRPTTRLSLEALESRQLMAPLVWAQFSAGQLTLTGNSEPNAIAIRELSPGVYDLQGLVDKTKSQMTPILGGTTFSGVQSVVFFGNDGNDEVYWYGQHGLLDSAFLDLGMGNDHLEVERVQALTFDILADDDHDRVIASDVHAATMNIFMGDGNDSLTGQDISANGSLTVNFGNGDDVGTLTSLSASRADMLLESGYDCVDIDTVTGNHIQIDLGTGQADVNFQGFIGQAGGVLVIDGSQTFNAIGPPAWQYTVTSARSQFNYDTFKGNEITFGNLGGPSANVYSTLNVQLGAADDVVRIVKQAVFHEDVNLDFGPGSDTLIVGDLDPRTGPSDIRFLKNLSAAMGGGTYDTVSLVGYIGRDPASQVNVSQVSGSPVAHIYHKYASLYEVGGRIFQRVFSLWPGRTRPGISGPIHEVDASLSRR